MAEPFPGGESDRMRSRSLLLWATALLITLVSAAYQRMTGPTYPVRGRVLVGSQELKFKLQRSHENPGDAEIAVSALDPKMFGTYEYRRYPSSDAWTTKPLERKVDLLIARLPGQAAAGKISYRIFIGSAGIEPVPLTSEPLILRFKDYVPLIPVLIPHIALMFVGMLCSTRAGFEALARGGGTRVLALWTAVLIFAGGLVLGPVVQKFAFGAYWTGWPVGNDLTDNKTALALIFWVIALWRLRKNPDERGWVMAAAVVTLIVFAIPHSVLGSQLDYTKGP